MIDFDGIDIGNILGSANVNLEHEESFDFIPTPSALDIGGGNTNLTNQHYLRAYSGGMPPSAPLQTPFDAYITAFGDAADNEQHINILPRNGNFIASHLEDPVPDVFDCSAFCENSEPIGPDAVCSFADYSISGFDGNINWTILPTGIANVDANGRVTRVGNNNGIVTLTAQFSGECGNATISKDIAIGVISPENVWGFMNSFSDIVVSTDDVLGASEYRWYLDGIFIQSSATPFTTLPEPSPCQYPDQVYFLEVVVINDCGASEKVYSFVDDERCAYDRSITNIIYPNPTSTQFTIDLSKKGLENTQLTKRNQLFEITITNQMGYVVKQLETQNEQIVVDVSDLRTGAYFVIIQSGGEFIRQTLIVE